jgi:hypothetical protein
MSVGKVVEVTGVSLVMEIQTVFTCVYSQSPYQHKNDDDAHDQKASFNF